MRFMEKDVIPALHLIEPDLFRMKFYVPSGKPEVSPDGIRIDIKVDAIFMNRHFRYYDDYSGFPISDEPLFEGVGKIQDSIRLQAEKGEIDILKILDVEPAVKALEAYGNEEYYHKKASFLLGLERSNLINQV